MKTPLITSGKGSARTFSGEQSMLRWLADARQASPLLDGLVQNDDASSDYVTNFFRIAAVCMATIIR